MDFVDDDSKDYGEPDGGWVTAPPLIDTEITSLTLCRYTGHQVGLDEFCFARMHGRHKDVSCVTLYFQAAAFTSDGDVDQSAFPSAQEVVRTHQVGNDVIGTSHTA